MWKTGWVGLTWFSAEQPNTALGMVIPLLVLTLARSNSASNQRAMKCWTNQGNEMLKCWINQGNEMLNKSRQTRTLGGLWAGSATERITFISSAPRSNVPSYSSWGSSFRHRFSESPGLSLSWECLLWGFICREKGLSSWAVSNHLPQLLHTPIWNCFRRF